MAGLSALPEGGSEPSAFGLGSLLSEVWGTIYNTVPYDSSTHTPWQTVLPMVLIIATGVYGGKLMFEHAAGIPTKTMQAEMQDREKAHHHEEGEAEEHEHPSAGTDTTHHDASGTSSHTH